MEHEYGKTFKKKGGIVDIAHINISSGIFFFFFFFLTKKKKKKYMLSLWEFDSEALISLISSLNFLINNINKHNNAF